MITKEKIANALQKLTSSETVLEGSFCLQHTRSLDDLPLQISIDGYGKLILPLPVHEAENLCKIGHPAQFGRRTQTLLDKNVRDTSEIPAEHVHIKYGTNDDEFLAIIDKIRKGLGLPSDTQLKAHLHNLLIYSPGQFFGPHQDGEKLDGMIATLVVVLPSSHRGGELIIEHQGEKKTLSCENIYSRKINFIAFYADCQHEVKPVKEGYRVVLTYNLVLESVKDKRTKPPVNSPALKDALIEYFTPSQEKSIDSRHPPQLVYLLDHSYTQHSLTWQLLKGSDRLRAQTLRAMADELGLNIYLTLANVHETWTAEVSGGYDYYEEDDDDAVPDELIDDELTLLHWLDTEGELVPFKETYVSKDEICWTKANEELEPFDSEYEGYVGNYGNTIDYWYHRAAVVMWRKSDQLAMQFNMDPKSILEELYEHTKQPGNQTILFENLRLLEPYLQTHFKNTSYRPAVIKLLKLACYIQNAALAYSILCYNDMLDISLETASVFADLQMIYDKEWCLKLLEKWQENSNNRKAYEDFSNIIKTLLSEGLDKAIAEFLLHYQLKVLMSIDKSDAREHDVRIGRQVEARVARMLKFLQAAHVLADADTYLTTIDYIIKQPKLYPQLELVKLLSKMEKMADKEKWGYALLKSHVSTALRVEFEQGLRSPDDWSILTKLYCACEDCKLLNVFLKSRKEQSKIWPIIEARRDHISTMIRGLELPVDIDIEKKSRPYKLILTKRGSIYDNAKKRFEQVTKACKEVLGVVNV